MNNKTVYNKIGKGITYLIVENGYASHDELRNISDVSELESLIKVNYDFNARIPGNKSAGILLLEDARKDCKLVLALNTDFQLEKGIGLVKSHKGFPKSNLIIELPYYGFFEITLKIFSGLNSTFFLKKLVSCNLLLSIKCPKERRAKRCKLIREEIVVEFKKSYPVLYDIIHTNYFMNEADFISFINSTSSELARELDTYLPNSFDSVHKNFWRGDTLSRKELFIENT